MYDTMISLLPIPVKCEYSGDELDVWSMYFIDNGKGRLLNGGINYKSILCTIQCKVDGTKIVETDTLCNNIVDCIDGIHNYRYNNKTILSLEVTNHLFFKGVTDKGVYLFSIDCIINYN